MVGWNVLTPRRYACLLGRWSGVPSPRYVWCRMLSGGLDTIGLESFIFTKILGSHFGQLLGISLSGGEKRRDDGAAAGGQLVTMAAWNFAQDAMSA